MTKALKDAAKSEAYRWGWEWASLGLELHRWLLPHLGTQYKDAERGWNDFHGHLQGPDFAITKARSLK
jgi:hypothetical protein